MLTLLVTENKESKIIDNVSAVVVFKNDNENPEHRHPVLAVTGEGRIKFPMMTRRLQDTSREKHFFNMLDEQEKIMYQALLEVKK